MNTIVKFYQTNKSQK